MLLGLVDIKPSRSVAVFPEKEQKNIWWDMKMRKKSHKISKQR